MSMRSAAALGVLLCAAPGLGRAEGWIVTIGGRVSASPPYEGAGHDVIVPAPTFSLRRADSLDRFTPPDDGTTLTLLSSRFIDLGAMARFRYARGNEGQLTGMDRIGWAAEPGAFVNLWPFNWLRLRAEGRHGIFGYSGWVGDAGADLIHTGKRHWDFSIGPRVGWGDARYMDTYFGVTPTEAARSPLITTAYEPGAGRRYLGAEAAVTYRIVGGLRVAADFGYHRLTAKAADSPIVLVAGSRNQYSGGVGLKYSFGVGH